jgi:hypothetical protein
MSYGLEVFDVSGNTTLSVTDRLTRVIGEVITGKSNGSVTNSEFLNGTPFYVFVERMGLEEFSVRYWPQVTVSGSTMSWSFLGGNSNTRVSVRLLYGVY